MMRKLIAILLLLLPLTAASDELRHVDVSYQMDVEVLRTAYPHLIWIGSGPLRYQWEKGEGRIMGGDIPQMTQRCPVEILGYKNVMMVMRGQAGTAGIVKVTDGEVNVSDLAFELDVMEGVPAFGVLTPPPGSLRSLLHMTFKNVAMTSGKLMVDGQTLQGKVDVDAMSVDLVFTTIIPATGNHDVDDAIAGKTVVGHFQIALKNPYQKN